MKIVLLTKTDEWCERAGQIAKALFGGGMLWVKGEVGQPIPEDLHWERPEFLISFLCPWIVPAHMIATGCALNFHPGSSHYPGIGCYNFALYEGANLYGAVCHRMLERVDSGEIIDERLFDVFPTDTVASLRLRTLTVMLAMYHDVMTDIAAGRDIKSARKRWTRRPFTRKELNDLCQITPDMSGDEIRRRVRATTYPGQPGAFSVIGGVKFSIAHA